MRHSGPVGYWNISYLTLTPTAFDNCLFVCPARARRSYTLVNCLKIDSKKLREKSVIVFRIARGANL